MVFEKKRNVRSGCHTNEKHETLCTIKHGDATGMTKFVINAEGDKAMEIDRSIDAPSPADHEQIARELDEIIKGSTGR
jgi:hypothetical protein